MRRTPVALITLVGSLVLAACSSENTTTSPPRGIVPQASSKTLLSFTCTSSTFSTMSQDAKAYFPAKDPVFDSIANMKKLFGTSVAAATPTGFNILTRTAAVRDAGLEIGSAAAGGKFVLDVVGCMDVGPVDDTFKPDQALDKGVFEVKGGSDADAALAKVAAAGHASTNASPLWGAEPNGVWTRGAAAYGSYLVYGYLLGPDVTTSGFEMGTIPQSISRNIVGAANLFRVGLCVPPANNGLTAANRLVHGGAIVTGLFDPSSSQDQGAHFCVNNVGVTNSSWLTRLANSAFSVFAPKALQAQLGIGYDGIGGLPDGWSPIIPNALPGSGITLSFDTQPPNTFADSLFTVVVKATNSLGAVPGVAVTVSVDNNHGVPAGAVISGGSPTGITGVDGKVSITISVGKAGGFILVANGALSSVPTQSVLSNQFQVQNK